MNEDAVERIFREADALSSADKWRLIQRLTGALDTGVAEKLPPASKRITLPTDELTYQIIGCAMALHRQLGSGYRENTYQRDLEVYFAQNNIPFVAQKLLDVYDSVDQRKLIGYYIPDFVVDQRVIVEIKALPGLDNRHEAQVIGYLAVTGYKAGLLLNFGQRSLEIKRVLPPTRVTDHRLNRQWLFVPEWLRESLSMDAEK
jgi:GxxExxY protein